MGRIRNLRDLIGVVKDKATQSKLALLSSHTTLSLHLSVLRVTAHSPHAPPDDHQIAALLSLGDGSRATASVVICALMDRLRRTGDCTVALKCLITIHHVIKRGPFILRVQLAVFPAAGGRNYLKLSEFRDGSSAAAWMISGWVRFYARYLESLLSASRETGDVIRNKSTAEKMSSFASSIRDVDSLVTLLEEICRVPDYILLERNKLLYEVMSLLSADYLSLVNELGLRLGELEERIGELRFADSVELGCGLRRLEDCKERLMSLFAVTKPSVKSLWDLVQRLKGRLDILKACREGRLLTFETSKACKSARFDRRVTRLCDSVRFSSGKYNHINNFAIVLSKTVPKHSSNGYAIENAIVTV